MKWIDCNQELGGLEYVNSNRLGGFCMYLVMQLYIF